MNKNSNVLTGLLIGLSAGTALGLLLKFNQRPKHRSGPLHTPANKIAKSTDKSLHNRFRWENNEDFEDHVEHI